MWKKWIASLLLSTATTLQAHPMLDALAGIRQVFETGYAPAEWKAEYSGWDLHQELGRIEAMVEENPDLSLGEFQDALAQFFRSTHDYHVSVRFTRSETSQLGFQVWPAEGKFIIVHVNRRQLSEVAFPFYPGDELLFFDGRPVGELVNELMEDYGRINGRPLTELSEAAEMLTERSRMRGEPCEEGGVIIGVRPNGTDKVERHHLFWNHEEELIRSLPAARPSALKALIERESIVGYHNKKLCDQRAGVNPFRNGATASMLPELGKVIWRTDDDDPVNAYIYENEDGRPIGFFRMPRFYFRGGCCGHCASESWEDYARVLKYLEENSDALVLDQMNNPGGYLMWAHGLASMFASEPIQLPVEREKIDAEDVLSAHIWLDELKEIKSDRDLDDWFDPDEKKSFFGVPVNMEFVRQWKESLASVIADWAAGETLSRPKGHMGQATLNPSPYARYTKPVLLLINERDYSCGDFFPAIMQDNGLATIMGVQTSGAGGYVLDAWFRNSVGLYSFSYTGSIAARADGNPVEDLGVQPDIECGITENDLRYNFEDFAAAVRAEIAKLL